MAGLVDALRKKRHCPDGEFEWYARVRIRGAILDELRRRDWATRGMRALERARRENGDSMAPSEGFSLIVDSSAVDELAASANDDSPLDAAERRSDRRALDHAVRQLPERDGAVVRMHYFEAVPFHEIAKFLRVTPARVSQIHARAIRGLRERLGREGAIGRRAPSPERRIG